ncbi:MAG: hypothetical protein DMG75_02370 [Acidobacteria bacterium]|nr:MAG: hypothetical protein DMG75_02370 [Acidobacteriota bacterium]
MYSSYEQLSTVAGEVENPQRSFPRALAIVVPLSVATYFLPTLAALAAVDNWQEWHTRYFSDAAQLIGRSWLGFWMTLAAMVTNISILNGTVLASTRMPSAMAEYGYLPSLLARLHPPFGTPWIAIIVSAIIYALFAFQTLTQLINVYVWLRVATSLMTVLSGWRLRVMKPEMRRTFVIPWGEFGVLYVVAAPIIMSYVVLRYSDPFAIRWGPAALLVGPVAYFLHRLIRRRSSHEPVSPC